MIGPRTYSHTLVRSPATIIGPKERAGLTDPPLTGPAINTPTASANPTAIGAMAAGALSSVATAITTKTSTKVMRISTTKACKSPTPCAGYVAASFASLLATAPKVSHVASAASTAPTSCAPTYTGV